MDSTTKPLPPIKTQSISPPSGSGFPILPIAVLAIIATSFLLLSYYIFVNKRCLNWNQLDPLRRFSLTRPTTNREDSLMAFSPSWQTRGLDPLLTRQIPSFLYTKKEGQERSLFKCVVCLNDFQEQDTLRVLPSCSHGFHLDCIDIWLQTNSNCPLCRLSISGTTRYPMDRIIAPTSSPQDPNPFVSSVTGSSDEDFVVIEVRNEAMGQSRRNEAKVKPRKLKRASIMGDECIDMREKDDQFSIEPIRRSFSMDSAVDRHVYSTVQEIIRQNRRPFFSLGNGRGSRSAVLPIES